MTPAVTWHDIQHWLLIGGILAGMVFWFSAIAFVLVPKLVDMIDVLDGLAGRPVILRAITVGVMILFVVAVVQFPWHRRDVDEESEDSP